MSLSQEGHHMQYFHTTVRSFMRAHLGSSLSLTWVPVPRARRAEEDETQISWLKGLGYLVPHVTSMHWKLKIMCILFRTNQHIRFWILINCLWNDRCLQQIRPITEAAILIFTPEIIRSNLPLSILRMRSREYPRRQCNHPCEELLFCWRRVNKHWYFRG